MLTKKEETKFKHDNEVTYIQVQSQGQRLKKSLIGGKLESLKMIIINAYYKLMSNYYI